MLNVIVDFKNLLIDLFNLLLFSISNIFKKNKNIWVFGAWYGLAYSDNSKYLFEYVNKHKKNIKAIWLTRNNKIVNLIRKKGYLAYHFNDIRSYYYCLKAGVAIFCLGRIYDLPTPYLSSKTKFVQLWHGISFKDVMRRKETFLRLKYFIYGAPYKNIFFKKIIVKIYNIFSKKRANQYEEIPYRYEDVKNYSLFITKSQIGKKKLEDWGMIENSKIVITGYPRNDILLSKKIIFNSLSKKLIQYKRKNYKIAIYMPTFREENNNELIEVLKSIKNIEKKLLDRKLILLIKIHPVLKYIILEKRIKLNIKNVIVVKEDDIYPFLKMTDCLITDYSSIFNDYLLLNKPIIFFPFDKNKYIKQRAFYLNYEKYTPGPKVDSWEEIINIISNLKEQKYEYERFRKSLNDFFNKYKDNKNSERVFYQIMNLFK